MATDIAMGMILTTNTRKSMNFLHRGRKAEGVRVETPFQLWQYKKNILRKGVSTMWVNGRIATGIAAAALLGMVNVGCAAKQPEAPRDTWTAAAQQANSAASRAEAAASKAEAAAARVEAAAKKCEDAAARIEAMTMKSMRK